MPERSYVYAIDNATDLPSVVKALAGDRGYAPRPWVSKTHVLLLYESPKIKSVE